MVEESLPNDYDWFIDQIAGHHPSVIKNGKREIGILKNRNDPSIILKPKQSGGRGECEVSVYSLLSAGRTASLRNGQKVSSNSTTSGKNKWFDWEHAREEDIRGLAKITAKFHGLQTLRVDGEDHEFMVLTDMTSPYTRPAILDIKVGKRTYDPLADREKQEKEASKYPAQEIIGFRLLGYKVHRSNNQVESKDKEWGKSYDETNVEKGLYEFFSARSAEDTKEVVSQSIVQIDRVAEWFAAQRSFHFFASSLLFVYEMDETKLPNISVSMIDFSHVFPAEGHPDENYEHGLIHLRERLQSLLSRD
ncbi:hypothetical protein WR25_19738 [Diploscapter pachys]|uniref:Kinase n=1 Tax=Diploscapter pachys TaxID=2018661 RepID=A0A2A2KTY8_9BILA|nr:hypothetical protein WR25_19738 [Diploscapter pachys]